MPGRQFIQPSLVQGLEHRWNEIVATPVPSSVHGFEGVEEQKQLLEMIHGELVIDAVKRMSTSVSDLLFPKVVAQIKDILAETLNLIELSFGDAPSQHMDFASIFREVRRDFVADKHAFEMGYFQGATNAVVIGNRNELHSTPPSAFVNRFGLGIALRGSDPPQDPF